MSVVHINLLGTLRLLIAGRVVALPQGAVLLLGYLALQTQSGRAITRSRLAGILWPDYEESRARRALSDLIYRLHRLLDDNLPWLLVEDESIALAEVNLDVISFGTLTQSKSVSDWQQAVALYEGDLLEEVDAEWVLASRAHLRETYLAILTKLCETLTRSGDLPAALTYAHRWTLADPLSDEACRTAMRLYARLGRHSAALQQYDRLTRVLSEELDLEPLPETRALARTIRSEAANSGGLEAVNQVHRPFVGRRLERAHLLALVEEAQAGRGALALIEGEPGVGKTRLLEELAEGARWRGLSVTWGRARELVGATPLAPLDEALTNALAGPHAQQMRDQLPAAVIETLSPLFPRLRLSTPSLTPTESPDLPKALAALCTALAATTPLLLIFDDVQWASTEFWSALRALTSTLSKQPLLIILGYRSEEARLATTAWQALRDLDREAAPAHILLNGLAADECIHLARELGQRLDETTALDLYERTRGNPLYVQEIALHGTPESQSLQRLIETRLLSLPVPARLALEAGAVLGREFTHGVWQAVAGSGILTEIPALIAARFIEESQEGYRFQHDVMREMGYQSLKPDRLRDLHQRAGEVLVHERVEPAVLAWHFGQAEAWPEAVHYQLEAGAAAQKAYAHKAALEHYTHGLTLLPHLSEAEGSAYRMQLLRGRAVTLYDVGPTEAWLAAINDLERESRAAGEGATLIEALIWRLDVADINSDWVTLRACAEEAIALAQSLGDPRAEGEARTALGHMLANSLGQIKSGLDHLLLAKELAVESRDETLLVNTLNRLAFTQRLAGQCRTALQTINQVVQTTADRPALRRIWINALIEKGVMELDLALWQAAYTDLQTAIESAIEIGDNVIAASAVFNQALACARIGQHALARHWAEYYISGWVAFGFSLDTLYGRWIRVVLAQAFTLAGDHESAQRIFGDLESWMDTRESSRAMFAARVALGALRLAQGRPAEAALVLEQAIETLGTPSLESVYALLLNAQAAQQLGQAALALANLTQAETLLTQSDSRRFEVLLFYTRFLVFDDVQYLQAAHSAVQEQAAVFTDPQLQNDFLQKVILHREIEAKWRTLQTTTGAIITVHLARTNTPLGKTLSEADRIEVQWTLDSGAADAEFLRRNGKIALRHHRLQRLIAEAQAQGATPTDPDLAKALGVNVRTIERDMALIRSQGKPVPTRRRKMSG